MWHIYPSEHLKSTACSCNSWQRCLLLQFWQCCQESLFETPSLIKYLEFSLSPIQHFLLVIIGISLLSCQCQKSAAGETTGTGVSTSCYMNDRELKCFDARESVARGNNCQIIISQDYMKPVTLSHGYCPWDSAGFVQVWEGLRKKSWKRQVMAGPEEVLFHILPFMKNMGLGISCLDSAVEARDS